MQNGSIYAENILNDAFTAYNPLEQAIIRTNVIFHICSELSTYNTKNYERYVPLIHYLLQHDPNIAVAWEYRCLGNHTTITIEIAPSNFKTFNVLAEALRTSHFIYCSRGTLTKYWSRQAHPVRWRRTTHRYGYADVEPTIADRIHGQYIVSTKKTNILFATLLLGIQRLEQTGTLLLAHQAMFEEMRECWTQRDNINLPSI